MLILKPNLHSLYASFYGFLDALFPIPCIGCNSIKKAYICEDCFLQIVPNPTVIHQENAAIDTVITWFNYDGLIKHALHVLKFNHIREIGARLSELPLYNQLPFPAKFDFIVPVPLSKKRGKERGFNQAELLFKYVNNGKALDELLVRVRNTPPLYEHTKKERQAIIENSFSLNKNIAPDMLYGKTVVLVDDILTTGATLTECARVLKNHGVIHITALCLTRADRPHL